ncbi:hypothetical protein L596_019436 [Steinernema carpocapsae]|uniref:Dehydrogenase/reductase SDR family member 1 n=1 Tax=Steinernema carpocapsae TaxID=34508 RepID=A0A4U5MQM9_STECR|nr:hypothetical protein L596_019436 [Steinernema carpocapsae]
MSKLLSGKVALVTGASRGLGKGIAVQLGAAGATVYVTGRPPTKQDAITEKLKLPSLEQAAKEISARGGKGIAIYCDHSDPEDVKRLFERIAREQNGRLDILVNNAYSAVMDVSKSIGSKFYDLDVSIFDRVNNVGLRNHYICSVYAARLMVPRKSGLIVTVSSGGGLTHLFNIAYGVGKSAKDRLAADMAHELLNSKICSVSLWPGAAKTEIINNTVLKANKHPNYKFFSEGESTELAGKCVVALATDSKAMEKTGKILPTAWLAKEYNLLDQEHVVESDEMLKKYANFLETLNKVRAPKSKI